MERREELHVQVIWFPSTNRAVDRRKETIVSQQIQQDRSDPTEWLEEERRCFHLQRKETAVLGCWGKRDNRCSTISMVIVRIGSRWSVTDRLRVDRRPDQLFNRRRISKQSNLLATQLSNHRQGNPSISCYLLAWTSHGTQSWIASTDGCPRTLAERRQEDVEECRLVICLLVRTHRFLCRECHRSIGSASETAMWWCTLLSVAWGYSLARCQFQRIQDEEISQCWIGEYIGKSS